VTAEKFYLLWALLPLAVAVGSSMPGRPWTLAQRVFAGLCVPVAFVLVAFVPRPAVDFAAGIVATLAVSAAVLAAWFALSPPARPRAALLAALVVAMDAAGLAVIYSKSA